MTYEDPYDSHNHKRHVASGSCDAIHSSKTWCDLKAGHEGHHFAAGFKRFDILWLDDENHPKTT